MDGAAAADGIEGVGESSSPPRAAAAAPTTDLKAVIYEKLVERGNEEAVGNPQLREQIAAHFGRLPASYSVDIDPERPEDVLVHQKILAEAKDPEKRPVCHVSFVKVEEQNSDMRRNFEDYEDGTDGGDALSVRRDLDYTLIHQIVFSTLDKPKLLSQLSALLSDIGLNIREAHVFSTTDGYSLDVFVVDGWSYEDAESLLNEIKSAIAINEGSWSGSSHSSATERLLALQPKDIFCDIDKKMLKMGEKIASGACGDLYRGTYMGQEVAIKVLRSEHLNETLVAEFNQEVSILRKVQHDNIVKFIGAYTNSSDFCILTEYMPGGNLYDYLHRHHNKLHLSLLLKFALDICKGMDYLHQNDIIHRDLKTANLLLDSNHVVKVADFGVARIQNQGGVMTAETGTYRWMAPEVINHQPYDQKADVFSFAIVLWELATSKIPYGTMTPLQAALGVRQGRRPELPENTHPRLLGLMQRCWETSPPRRPTFSEVIVELQELMEEVQQEVGGTSHPGKDVSKDSEK